MNPFSWVRHKFAARKGADPPPGHRKQAGILRRYLPFLFSDYTLRNSELIFAATSRIGNSLSAMPIQLYKGTEQIKSDLNDLMRIEPNPNMTACQFVKTMSACCCTTGNTYALKVLDKDYNLTRLDILDPGRVKPVMDETSNELWYEITTEKQGTLFVHNFYILHIPFISTNGYSGINPVSVLFDTLTYSKAIHTFSVQQLEKGVNASIILEAPANLGEGQKESMIEDLLGTYKKTGGDIVLLESGVTAKSLNLSPVDTKLFEVEKITRGKVAMVYNLPPHMLGDYSDTSFATMEQQTLEFLTLTMLPIVTAWEQELDRKLLTKEQRREGYTFRFNMDAILRADAATTADVNQKAVRGGWKLLNEIRKVNGDPELANGNVPLVSRDLTTLDFIVQHPETIGGRSQNAGQQEPAPAGNAGQANQAS